MTKLLEQAFQKARKLPAETQDLVARLVLDVLDDERRWAELLAAGPSQEALERLADEALGEYRGRQTTELDPDRL